MFWAMPLDLEGEIKHLEVKNGIWCVRYLSYSGGEQMAGYQVI